jgi:DegV family protein with EDD domain
VPRIAIVTDSTASLTPEVAQARGITVVPLQVVIGAASYDEGSEEATPEKVAEALRAWKPVSTSRPTPAAMLAAYRAAAAAGAEAVVSIHLSAEMSGTFESALLAAKDAPIPVLAVDSRQVGFATGYAVLTAADAVEAGASAEDAADAARRRASAATSLFYVDTLEYLRRGGRVGAAAAIFGSALAVKPLLRIDDGRIDSIEKVRTSSKALGRLADLAVESAGDRRVCVGVAHLANPERADALTAVVAERLADNLEGREIQCAELGAVIGAHVGPGMVAVCVAPLA